MKKRFIYLMIFTMFFSYISIGGLEYHQEITSIEYLLNQRIEIMNEFLYGYKDMDSLKEKLMNIERDKLFDNDTDILQKIADNPTDFELAMSVKVDKIHSLKRTEEGININVDLNWQMSGYDGEFNMVRNYDIKCIEEDKQMYLASLIIQD
ncbi:hypothetical protein HZF24_00755 [Sedimentibacter hydroxybenzoicus DSM 7310]|uniref:Uncharacterized protein n=1 Tax=Sedimentibacter hydroxybenzoicus DSM 7310 TaxID=1123245 RepID=A0A974BGH2_SEDHY|nr:hypothetical protein [Sedimentibacter hydroxybenzoicus]NYB72663.1 hypothetical protein [Sedimentibacter hydroxybenzoicus DSM 7310]